ncbi:hypothetical protein DFS34DRAFT_592406 [Phlyctochytrium arcticum]|nr:hypothetical protein DFS34DRAFT_592406 [Phlyctochytrium arcticum]
MSFTNAPHAKNVNPSRPSASKSWPKCHNSVLSHSFEWRSKSKKENIVFGAQKPPIRAENTASDYSCNLPQFGPPSAMLTTLEPDMPQGPSESLAAVSAAAAELTAARSRSTSPVKKRTNNPIPNAASPRPKSFPAAMPATSSTSSMLQPRPPIGRRASTRRKPVGRYAAPHHHTATSYYTPANAYAGGSGPRSVIDSDRMSRCDSLMTDVSTESTVSAWVRGLKKRGSRAGSIRSTSTTFSTRERMTSLFHRLAIKLGIPARKSDLYPHDIYYPCDDPLPAASGGADDPRWAKGGTGPNIRPTGPRRMQGNDAAAVWANVIAKYANKQQLSDKCSRSAHTTKGSAQTRAFRHLLKERDDARAECYRLQSALAASPKHISELARIATEMKKDVAELGQSLLISNNNPVPRDAHDRLEKLAVELEAVVQVCRNAAAATGSASAHPIKPTATSAVKFPDSVLGTEARIPSSVPSLQVSRQSSARTLSEPEQQAKSAIQVNPESSVVQSVVSAPAVEIVDDQTNASSHSKSTANPVTCSEPEEPQSFTHPKVEVISNPSQESDSFSQDIRTEIDQLFADNLSAPEAVTLKNVAPDMDEVPMESVTMSILSDEKAAQDTPEPPPRRRQTQKGESTIADADNTN